MLSRIYLKIAFTMLFIFSLNSAVEAKWGKSTILANNNDLSFTNYEINLYPVQKQNVKFIEQNELDVAYAYLKGSLKRQLPTPTNQDGKINLKYSIVMFAPYGFQSGQFIETAGETIDLNEYAFLNGSDWIISYSTNQCATTGCFIICNFTIEKTDKEIDAFQVVWKGWTFPENDHIRSNVQMAEAFNEIANEVYNHLIQ